MTGKRAFLCVDDDKLVLDSLKEQLRGAFGLDTLYESAECANDAWEIIEELVDDEVSLLLIVSDWLMPGVRGDEFLVAVHERFPKVVKILVTGQADQAAIDNATVNGGLVACLAKPWSEGQLVEIITANLP
jgi:CheY-like chemotaxis protein